MKGRERERERGRGKKRCQCTRESGTKHVLCSCKLKESESGYMTQEHTGCLLGLKNKHRSPESPCFWTQIVKRKDVDVRTGDHIEKVLVQLAHQWNNSVLESASKRRQMMSDHHLSWSVCGRQKKHPNNFQQSIMTKLAGSISGTFTENLEPPKALSELVEGMKEPNIFTCYTLPLRNWSV